MRVAWVLLLLCGCTAIFDLRSASNGDRDADGYADDRDNCPDVYNPDQSNFDADESGDACDECIATAPDVDDDGIPDPCDGCIGNGIDLDNDQIDDNCTCVPMGVDDDVDGVDDNCDPCLLGPQHDEDGDGVMDACDNCPGIQNTTQINADPAVDEVGDACDGDEGRTLRTFDNFMAENSEWFQFGAGWSRRDGSYFFAAKAPTLRALGTTKLPFRVIAGVRFAQPGSTSTVFELYAADSPVPVEFSTYCRLTDTGVLTAEIVAPPIADSGSTPTAGVGFDPSGHIIVVMDVDYLAALVTCMAIDRDGRTLKAEQPGTIPQQTFQGMGGSGSAEVTFFELLFSQ